MTENSILRSLQNGSDIRGIAISTADHEANLTTERARKIGHAFIQWLKKEKNLPQEGEKLRIAIGQDSRLSGDDLKAALMEGMASEPLEIYDCGLATTPAMFMATLYDDFQVDGSIMITASHLPFEYNGFKFFTASGGAEHEEIEQILALAADLTEEIGSEEKAARIIQKDLLSVYAADLVKKIREGIPDNQNPEQPLWGRHIVVDAGNGAGGFFVEKVLQPLGADTTGSQFLQPDGTFPHHEPNPDNKKAMKSIQEAVLRHQADLGIIFDTDVDRSALVDAEGQVFNRNNLIALISSILLKEEPGATIVTNSATSQHLETFITEQGGKQDRYLTGYRNVINRAIELDRQGEQAVLAIETSGHAALKENYYLDDGAYLIAKLLMADASLVAEGKQLGDLIRSLKQPQETTEYRFIIIEEPIFENGHAIIERFRSFLEGKENIALVKNHLEGIRADFSGPSGSGWFILRMSLHEPLLVWTLESDETGKIPLLVDTLMPFFMEQKELDRDKIIRK